MQLCKGDPIMGNKFGNAYGLTVLIPVKHGADGNRAYDKIIRDKLQAWRVDKDSPMAKVPNTYLSRVFRKQVGIPMSQYRNSLRLARFWEQYTQKTSRNLTEAMFAAGFGSYAQFYRVFRETYGRGPREILRAGV